MAEPARTSASNGPPLVTTLDTRTVEVLAHTLFGTVFREGVRVPIRVSGLVDMDVVVKDNNVLLNVGRVEAEIPALSLWRITLAYRGHPVVDYGRGIPNDAKVHVPRLCFLLLMSWTERRRRFKARARAERERNRDLATITPEDRHPGLVGEPRA
jgi:hypothetical protein